MKLTHVARRKEQLRAEFFQPATELTGLDKARRGAAYLLAPRFTLSTMHTLPEQLHTVSDTRAEARKRRDLLTALGYAAWHAPAAFNSLGFATARYIAIAKRNAQTAMNLNADFVVRDAEIDRDFHESADKKRADPLTLSVSRRIVQQQRRIGDMVAIGALGVFWQGSGIVARGGSEFVESAGLVDFDPPIAAQELFELATNRLCSYNYPTLSDFPLEEQRFVVDRLYEGEPH